MFSIFVFAQKNDNFSVGFESNSQYYLDDSKTGDFTQENRFRSNSYLKTDYTAKNFYLGVQLEIYEPKALLNYSPNLDKTNLGLYYAGYKSNNIDITLGHFYEQFGSGLILRNWEDRQLGINNALRGGRIKYNPTSYLQLTALFGQQRYGFKHSSSKIYGFNTDVDLTSIFNLNNSLLDFGFSFVGRNEGNLDKKGFDFNDTTNAFSIRLDWSKGSFYTNSEFVLKDSDAIYIFNGIKNAKKGNAFLLNLGYAKRGLGVDATFRRMENMTFYSNRVAIGNDFNESIINYVPALTKQHDYLLTNIYVYQAQPKVSFQDVSLMKAGEIGGQLDVFYKFKKGTTLGGRYGTKIAFNTSYWAGLSGNFDYTNFDYKTNFFGFGERYFSDISLEVRKKFSKKWSSIFYYVNQNYNKRFVEETIGNVKTNILVGEATYKIGGGKSLRFEAQHLWTKDDRKNWAGGTIEFNVNSRLGFYINDIYNYGTTNEAQKIHYYNFGGSYAVGAHRFALNYGRQRGGLLCVGGVCRMVPESTGLSANIIMAF